MIVAPAFADDEVVGLVAVTRDAPGRPYTRVDLVTAERAARSSAPASPGAPHFRVWARRRSLVAAVSSVLDGARAARP